MSELKLLLSYLRALYQLYQHEHWQSSGANYYGDHLLYDRLVNSVQPEIDQVAEKTIGITNDSKSINPVEDSKITSKIVEKFTSGEFNPESFPEIAIAAEKELLKLISDLMSKKPSDGVQNMLQGIADLHEGHLYLLQQRDKKAGAIINDLVKMANELDSMGQTDIADQIDDTLKLIATDKDDAIMFEMADILARIRRITENNPHPDSLEYERLSFLREKYKNLKSQLKEKYEF